MGIYRGPNGHLVKSSDIYAINLLDATIIPEGTGDIGLNGGYQVKCYFGSSDCNTSAIFLQLKNNIVWTNIACEFELCGTSSCWGFNATSYGVVPSLGYLQPYNESLGDIIPNYRCKNTWEIPLHQTHNKVSACDNDSNNFFRGINNPKTFIMKRRRDTSGNYAGINHGRACKAGGIENYTIIKNIYIW